MTLYHNLENHQHLLHPAFRRLPRLDLYESLYNDDNKVVFSFQICKLINENLLINDKKQTFPKYMDQKGKKPLKHY